MFGGVSILAVGNLYQLPPVGQPALFDTVTDAYACLYGSGSLWKDEFNMIELDEIMRQRGDSTFTELLCRVRLGELIWMFLSLESYHLIVLIIQILLFTCTDLMLM